MSFFRLAVDLAVAMAVALAIALENQRRRKPHGTRERKRTKGGSVKPQQKTMNGANKSFMLVMWLVEEIL